MKTIYRQVFLVVALGVFISHAQRARAQVPQIVEILSGVELRQNDTVDKNGVTTIKPPTRMAVSTRTLLQDLAKDETTNGTWFAGFDNKVPTGAKLEVIYAGAGDFSTITFEVIHGTNLVDVSNIITAAPADTSLVTIDGSLDANGTAQAPYYTIILRRYTIGYDARPMGDALHFTITGMGTTDALGAKPNAKGVYTEGDAFALGYGSGGGVDSTGTPFILSNVSIAAIGKARLTDPSAAPSVSSGTSLDAAQAAGNLGGDEFPAWALLGGSLTNGSSQTPPVLPGVQSFSLQ